MQGDADALRGEADALRGEADTLLDEADTLLDAADVKHGLRPQQARLSERKAWVTSAASRVFE